MEPFLLSGHTLVSGITRHHQEPQGSFRRRNLWALLRNRRCARSSVWARTEPACLKISSYSFPKPWGLPPVPVVHLGAKDPLKAIGTVSMPRGGWFVEDVPQIITCWISHCVQARAAKPQPVPREAPLTPAARDQGFRTANIPGSTYTGTERGCEPLLEADHQAPHYPKRQAKGYTACSSSGEAGASSAHPSKSTSTSRPGRQFLWKLLH